MLFLLRWLEEVHIPNNWYHEFGIGKSFAKEELIRRFKFWQSSKVSHGVELDKCNPGGTVARPGVRLRGFIRRLQFGWSCNFVLV